MFRDFSSDITNVSERVKQLGARLSAFNTVKDQALRKVADQSKSAFLVDVGAAPARRQTLGELLPVNRDGDWASDQSFPSIMRKPRADISSSQSYKFIIFFSTPGT
jgi:hypothetical protein